MNGENIVKLKDPFKRGDTFGIVVEMTLEEEPIVFDIENLRSQVRTRNNKLIAELEIEATEEDHVFLFKKHDTNDWPIGHLYMDIEINDGDFTTSSPTIEIEILRDVTRDD